MKSSNLGKPEHRKKAMSSSSKIADSSIDWTIISTSLKRIAKQTSESDLEICQ